MNFVPIYNNQLLNYIYIGEQFTVADEEAKETL